jgi:hypothetical protein
MLPKALRILKISTRFFGYFMALALSSALVYTRVNSRAWRFARSISGIRRAFLAEILLLTTFVYPQVTEQTVSVEERALLTTRIYADLRTFFAHWSAIPEFDLEREFPKYQKEALEAESRKEFDMATLRFFAKLKNGHTGFNDATLWGTEKQVGLHCANSTADSSLRRVTSHPCCKARAFYESTSRRYLNSSMSALA